MNGEIKTFDVKVEQTRDSWELKVTIAIAGFDSRAHAAFAAGKLTGAVMQSGVGVPRCSITDNFDEA